MSLIEVPKEKSNDLRQISAPPNLNEFTKAVQQAESKIDQQETKNNPVSEKADLLEQPKIERVGSARSQRSDAKNSSRGEAQDVKS